MANKKKNTPKTGNSYPLFGFRVSADTKEKLVQEVSELLSLYNSDENIYEKSFSKKDIFLKALGIGFKELRRRKKR